MPFPTYATQAEIPKGFEDEYEEKDGKWSAKVPDTSTLEADLAAEKTKREAAEKLTRKAAQDLQKEQLKNKAADAGMTEEKLKELRAEVRTEVLAEVQPQLDRALKVEQQNRSLLLDSDMKARALKAGILPDKVADFWDLRGKEFDLTDDGKPMVKGKPGIDPDKHLETLKKMNPEWVAPSKASGSGATGSGSGGVASGVTEADLAHPERLIEAGNATAR